jgi:hypothetical protein
VMKSRLDPTPHLPVYPYSCEFCDQLNVSGCRLGSSEKTPVTALMMMQLVKEAGFPPGVINLLTGDGLNCGHFIAHVPPPQHTP